MGTSFILPLDFKVSLDLTVFLNSENLDVDYLVLQNNTVRRSKKL
jgi:hypothetical protein